MKGCEDKGVQLCKSREGRRRRRGGVLWEEKNKKDVVGEGWGGSRTIREREREKVTSLTIGIIFSLGLLQVSSTKNHPNHNCLVSKL